MTESEKRLLELVLGWQTDAQEVVAAKDAVYVERCPQELLDECILEESLHKVALQRYRDFLKRIKRDNLRGVAAIAMQSARNVV